jgi:hypothetical protein
LLLKQVDVRSGRNATRWRFRTARFSQSAQAVEVDGFRHLVEVENPKTTTYRNSNLQRAVD